MATQTNTVDMTIMLATHDAFRRDLGRFRDAADSHTFPLERWNVFTNVLHVHHTSEDEFVWPLLRDRLEPLTGDVPVLEQMVDEHARIEPLLAGVERAFEQRDGLADAIDALAGSLGAHLDHEERNALPLVAASVSPEEWAEVGRQMQGLLGADGAAEFFPWLLDGMPDERAQDVLGVLPPPLQTVYERVWRPQYTERVGR
jgi:hypothetical protein